MILTRLLLTVNSLPRCLLSTLQRLTSSRQHVPRLSANAIHSTIPTSYASSLRIWRIVRRLLIPWWMLQTPPLTPIYRRRRRHRTTCIRTLERTSHRPQVQRCRTRLTRRSRSHSRPACKLRVAGRRLCELRWRRVDPCLSRDVRCCVTWLWWGDAAVRRGARGGGCWAGAGLGRWRGGRVLRCGRGYVTRGGCWCWVGVVRLSLGRDPIGLYRRVLVGWNWWHGGLISTAMQAEGWV